MTRRIIRRSNTPVRPSFIVAPIKPEDDVWGSFFIPLVYVDEARCSIGSLSCTVDPFAFKFGLKYPNGCLNKPLTRLSSSTTLIQSRPTVSLILPYLRELVPLSLGEKTSDVAEKYKRNFVDRHDECSSSCCISSDDYYGECFILVYVTSWDGMDTNVNVTSTCEDKRAYTRVRKFVRTTHASTVLSLVSRYHYIHV